MAVTRLTDDPRFREAMSRIVGAEHNRCVREAGRIIRASAFGTLRTKRAREHAAHVAANLFSERVTRPAIVAVTLRGVFGTPRPAA